MPKGLKFVGFDRVNIWIISLEWLLVVHSLSKVCIPNVAQIKTEFPEVLHKIMQLNACFHLWFKRESDLTPHMIQNRMENVIY